MGDPPAGLVHPPPRRDAAARGPRRAGRLGSGQRLGGVHRRGDRDRAAGGAARGGPGMTAATAGKRANPRRRVLVEAALRLIGRHGAGAVTHRMVAHEAGPPLASTTYYFDAKAALVEEALALVIERSVDAARTHPA